MHNHTGSRIPNRDFWNRAVSDLAGLRPHGHRGLQFLCSLRPNI